MCDVFSLLSIASGLEDNRTNRSSFFAYSQHLPVVIPLPSLCDENNLSRNLSELELDSTFVFTCPTFMMTTRHRQNNGNEQERIGLT